MNNTLETRPPIPPFTRETALQKVRLAENAWNNQAPQQVALAYTIDSLWRNRNQFIVGREQIIDFLTQNLSKVHWKRLKSVLGTLIQL